jgi:DNA polymerase-1
VWELEAALAPRLVEEGLTRVKDLENQVIWVVCEMERNGCPLDEATLDTWLVESDQTYQRILWNIYRDTGLSINPQRPADLVTLCLKLKLIVHHTEDGRASFTDTILDAYQHPVINRVRQARKLASLRSKYLVKYRQAIGADGILRYALHQLRVDTGGTVTGRFSSSALQRGVGVNIQQVPATDLSPDYPIRALHRPASGQWLSADADQIEYRLFANRAKNEEVLAAYQADPYVNFHQVIQDKIRQAHFHVNLSYADVKTMNFCRLYGGGKARIAEMLGMISQEQYQFLKRTNSGSDHPWLDDAAALMRIYDDALPQVTHMLRVASRSAISNGYVATALGRRARLTHQESYKAMNRIIQGTAADVMKEKLVDLHAARKSTGFTLRFTVHDEVCGDCPDTDSRRAVHAILNTQDRPLPIPLLWTVRTGASWAACE